MGGKLGKSRKFKLLVFCNGAWCDTINIEMRRRDTMPELSRFGGMVIYMLFMDTKQHNKPHVHGTMVIMRPLLE